MSRPRIPSHPTRGPALVALLAVLACLAPAGAAAQGRTEAEAALDRAEALFRPQEERTLRGPGARVEPRSGTPVLRELAARVRELAPAERARAERLLARPTTNRDPVIRYRVKARRTCDPRMCFWWVRKGVDAPRLADGNRNRVPDWVDRVRNAFAYVWRKQIRGFGYRRPRSDLRSRTHGPNGKLDIYVADTGRFGIYGYCTSDDPGRFRRRAVSAYCVVDDDFARRQFPVGAAGRAALRVTAAHEFFHAVQFAYDWLEDLWLMEGSAAWIEDEIFDGVDDNRQFLAASPLTGFRAPLDWFHENPAHPDSARLYGAWIFFRYLSERFGRDVVRSVWRRADANRGAPNEYSTRAVQTITARKGGSFPAVFAEFGTWNLVPGAAYSEGAAYPTPVPSSSTALTPDGLDRTSARLDHLAHDFHRFVPSGLAPEATVTFAVELPSPLSSAGAHALARASDGTLTVIAGALDAGSGEWRIPVPGAAAYADVTLVLTNAGARFHCWRGTLLSCEGISRDDARDFFFRADVA